MIGTGTVGLKICGVTRREDVQACARLGVQAVGLNFWSGSTRYLSEDAATELVVDWPPGLQRVGVFVDAEPSAIASAVARFGLDVVQLHGERHPDAYEELSTPLCWVVRGTPELDELTRQRPRRPPCWVLLDAAVQGYGGAGTTTDWSWAARAVEALAPWPVWLAGGLRPANAAQAIAAVRPAGLDAASGVETATATHGEKDPDAIAALVAICNNAGRERS